MPGSSVKGLRQIPFPFAPGLRYVSVYIGNDRRYTGSVPAHTLPAALGAGAVLEAKVGRAKEKGRAAPARATATALSEGYQTASSSSSSSSAYICIRCTAITVHVPSPDFTLAHRRRFSILLVHTPIKGVFQSLFTLNHSLIHTLVHTSHCFLHSHHATPRHSPHHTQRTHTARRTPTWLRQSSWCHGCGLGLSAPPHTRRTLCKCKTLCKCRTPHHTARRRRSPRLCRTHRC